MSRDTPPENATAIGIALVVFGSAAMAMGPTFARLALDGGASVLTVVATRGLIGVVVMAGVVIIAGQTFRLRRTIALLCLLSGLCYTLMSYGFIGAVAYIPVSLMMLLFFVHPIIVAVVHHVRGETPLTRGKFALIAVVFIGLGFALAPDLTNLHPLGIALALLAALGATGMIFLNASAQKGAASTVITFYMTLVTVFVFAVVTSLADDWQFPQTTLGWTGLWGTGLGLSLGLLSYFAAFRFIGPVRTSLISTVEPLLAIVFAVAVLAETLGPLQWFGALAVVSALVLFELPHRAPKG